MGAPRRGTKRGGSSSDAKIRRTLVKQLLIRGATDPEIVELFGQGVSHAGRVLTAAPRVVYQDLQAIGEEWRGLHDDPLVTEREVGAIRARVSQIATAAQARAFPADVNKKGDASFARVALQANGLLLRLAGLRSSRWRRDPLQVGARGPGALPALPGPVADAGELDAAEEARVLAAAAEIRGLTDAQLLARVRAARARVESQERRVAELSRVEVLEGDTSASEG